MRFLSFPGDKVPAGGNTGEGTLQAGQGSDITRDVDLDIQPLDECGRCYGNALGPLVLQALAETGRTAELLPRRKCIPSPSRVSVRAIRRAS
ncbi:hypothetical protein [Bacteroides fragilis]|uniref:hypothetical protein n=1 Tax=Bacteroides fragilis TaxID=817 RepID=UPI001CCC8AC0|nr:hypothetical protein [Bacteroides fragilis]